jgi:multidrug efflux pump subunit AcrA (membrane-fusion protein)
MTRCFYLIVLFALTVSVAWAQDPPEPPVRLKKKNRPAEATPEKKVESPAPSPEKKSEPPVKPGEPKKDGEPKKEIEPKDEFNPEAARRQEQVQEVLNRIGKNMKSSEDRLGQHDSGEGTQQVQQDVVKDFDALIELNKQQQQQQQQQQQSRSQRQQARQKRNQQEQQAKQQQQQQQQLQEQPTNDPSGGGRGGKGDKNNLADLYKDIWGHLPETMRLEMDQYARERFMPRYSEMLKQYYTTIAEKGRRKQ